MTSHSSFSVSEYTYIDLLLVDLEIPCYYQLLLQAKAAILLFMLFTSNTHPIYWKLKETGLLANVLEQILYTSTMEVPRSHGGKLNENEIAGAQTPPSHEEWYSSSNFWRLLAWHRWSRDCLRWISSLTQLLESVLFAPLPEFPCLGSS